MAVAVRYIWACLLVVPLDNVNTWHCYRNTIIKPIFVLFIYHVKICTEITHMVEAQRLWFALLTYHEELMLFRGD